jgi:hypothetical protein
MLGLFANLRREEVRKGESKLLDYQNASYLYFTFLCCHVLKEGEKTLFYVSSSLCSLLSSRFSSSTLASPVRLNLNPDNGPYFSFWNHSFVPKNCEN